MADLALTHGEPSKLLAIGRRFASTRGRGKRRAEKAGAWKREHAINARAQQLIRTRTHLRAAPGIFVLDERAVFVYMRARKCVQSAALMISGMKNG